MRLQTKLILLIGSLLLLVVATIAYYFEEMQARMLKEQIGTRALKVAETVASIPAIRDAFDDEEPWKVIQPIAEDIRRKTGAEFIVVGNRDGIRYSHPLPDRIGKTMVGGDNEPVLQGKPIISEAVGSLGPSLRGKAPIFDKQGKVIGIVSVGFMLEDIQASIWSYRLKIILLGAGVLLVGILGALLIAYSVKRAIMGLEPAEIGRLYQEKHAILDSIREGILAIDRNGIITMVNHTAVTILGLQDGVNITGKPLKDVLPTTRLLEVVRTGKAEYDKEMIIGDNLVVVNRVPIIDNKGQVIGAVASFRNKSELNRLSEELSQVRRYAESLRAQTHEFSNKLYMISGLIQLESYQEAIELITRESDVHQNLVQFIMKEIPDPVIGGLLIGKFNRAKELKVDLVIDPESSFRDVPPHIDRNELVTILGNLIDNAMEAVLASGKDLRTVKVFLTDLGEDLIIEVEDSGNGVPEAFIDRIYDVGFSTKANDGSRGFGLALVKLALQQLNGYITYTRNSPNETIFTVAIPKYAKDERKEAHG